VRRRLAVALLASGLLLAACGKYGKPTRQAPSQDRGAETRYTLPATSPAVP